MKINIEIISLTEARQNRTLMRTLYALTLRGISSMRNELNSVCSVELSDKYKIILAKNDEKVVGWAMIFPVYLYQNVNYAYFYVARAARKKGVGSVLFKSAKEVCDGLSKSMWCSPWDVTSAKFFMRNNAVAAEGYEYDKILFS